jgi:hypothetical protein
MAERRRHHTLFEAGDVPNFLFIAFWLISASLAVIWNSAASRHLVALAATEATVAKGAGLLAVYSLGLGIPFVLAAFAAEPFAAFLARFRRHVVHTERVTRPKSVSHVSEQMSAMSPG